MFNATNVYFESGEVEFKKILKKNPDLFLNYSYELYASLCNIIWINRDLKEFTCSWRSAGRLVADLRNKGEKYIDFYCNGGEGVVSHKIASILFDYDWLPFEYDAELEKKIFLR